MTGRLAIIAGALALVVAACGTVASRPGSPAPSGQPAEPVSPAPSGQQAEPVPSVSPSASGSFRLPGPPDAELGADATRTLGAGTLASFTWDQMGSDGPWIVGPVVGSVRQGETLRVAFGDDSRTTRWQASWAPLRGRSLGPIVVGETGTSQPVSVHAPGLVGAWDLAVTGSFGIGRSATWTWQVEVLP